MVCQVLSGRRPTLASGAAAAVVAAAIALGGGAPAARAADTVPVAQLMAEPALPDNWLGSKDAPVTIVEYASMTCTHCAAFHQDVWPTLKSKYIDTGKVRFVLREFPLDPFATAGFMLARCAGPDRYYPITDLLFAQQKNWAFGGKPLEGLSNTVKQAGITQAAFDACLKDQGLYDKINKERDDAGKAFKVEATPTFFINGERHAGEMTVEELDKVLTPLVKS